MIASESPSGSLRSREVATDQIKVSRYDRTSALLVAILIVTGFIATTLGVIWLGTPVEPAPKHGPFDPPTASKLAPEPVEGNLVDPGVEEFPEIATPQSPQALEAVTEAVSKVSSALAERSSDLSLVGLGSDHENRQAGPVASDSIVPEHKRWKISYQAQDIIAYKQQLSFWKIDIGVLNRTTDEVYRVNDPAGQIRVIQSSREAERNSLYFTHLRPTMIRWDQAIASEAGVDVQDTNLIQFYSAEARQRIQEREQATLAQDDRDVEEIQTTIIRLVREENKFDFVVERINYR